MTLTITKPHHGETITESTLIQGSSHSDGDFILDIGGVVTKKIAVHNGHWYYPLNNAFTKLPDGKVKILAKTLTGGIEHSVEVNIGDVVKTTPTTSVSVSGEGDLLISAPHIQLTTDTPIEIGGKKKTRKKKSS